jgi:malate synthase
MPKLVDLPGVEILAPITENHAGILSPEAIDFIVDLQRTFNVRRKEMLNARAERQRRLDAGERPKFLEETRSIRESEWTVAPMPADLIDRRVDITGPVDRKMIINALNSGAKIFMADFEDSSTPTWNNLLDGHINLRDAVGRTITYADPTTGKQYKLNEKVAVLFVRPRGWHLEERHVLVDGEPMSGSSSILDSTFSIMPRDWWRAAAGHTSICPRWKATWRRGCGTMCSSVRKRKSARSRGPFEGPC